MLGHPHYDAWMSLDDRTLKKIGGRIRDARSHRKISQERLAELSGLSNTYIGRLERGEKTPSLDTLAVLAKCLKVSPVDLLIDLDTHLGKEVVKSRVKKLVDLL